MMPIWATFDSPTFHSLLPLVPAVPYLYCTALTAPSLLWRDSTFGFGTASNTFFLSPALEESSFE